jgi:FAD:protein FMN transferase
MAVRLERFSFSQIRMGVDTPIIVYAPSEARAVEACRAAYTRISQLEQQMSDYRADSELNMLCKEAVGRWRRVSRELFYVLWRAHRLAQQTDGAFDPTVGVLVRLWREARRTGRLPDAQTLQASARPRRLPPDGTLPPPTRRAPQSRGMQLDLGGIAKGYACDHALRVLRRYGITRALIQMGGDIVAGEPPPDAPAWRIALAEGGETTLARGALSTSGSTEQFVEIDGVRYAHIIDPRTGLGLDPQLILARVRARDGITADSLATAAAVLGTAGIPHLQRLYKGVQIEVQEA